MNFFHLTYVEAGSPVRTEAPLALATRMDASTAIFASSRARPRMASAAISGLIDVPHFSGLVSTTRSGPRLLHNNPAGEVRVSEEALPKSTPSTWEFATRAALCPSHHQPMMTRRI